MFINVGNGRKEDFKMKKVTSLLICISLSISFFSGCLSNDSISGYNKKTSEELSSLDEFLSSYEESLPQKAVFPITFEYCGKEVTITKDTLYEDLTSDSEYDPTYIIEMDFSKLSDKEADWLRKDFDIECKITQTENGLEDSTMHQLGSVYYTDTKKAYFVYDLLSMTLNDTEHRTSFSNSTLEFSCKLEREGTTEYDPEKVLGTFRHVFNGGKLRNTNHLLKNNLALYKQMNEWLEDEAGFYKNLYK